MAVYKVYVILIKKIYLNKCKYTEVLGKFLQSF